MRRLPCFAALCFALLLPVSNVDADGWPLGDQATPAVQNGQPTTGLFITHSQSNPPASGDWISAAAGGNTYYSYFVEVPSGASNLVVEIFDPDVFLGGSGEGSAAALPHFDQQRGSGSGATDYTLLDPSGTSVQTINGTTTTPVGSHATWFGFTTVASPTNGHWEVRVDSLAVGGNVGGYGIRASATVDGGPRQLRVYADAHLSVQNYGLTGVYVAHPYITGFCQVRIRDFDADSDTGQIGTASSILLRSDAFSGGPGAQSQNFSGAGVMSGNDDLWQANDTTVAWHSDFQVARRGIYTTEIRPRSTGTTNEFQVGFFNPNGPANNVSPVVPAAGASWANSWRTYLPTPDGTVDGRAPDKPYVTQDLFHVSGPNPATVGNLSTYRVTIRVRNITEYPITFSATNLVRVFIPSPAVRNAAAPTLSQGTVVTIPAAGASGQVEWNPGTVAANSDAILSYLIDLTPAALGRIPVTGTPASNGTTARYVDETGNTTQTRATYEWGPLCELAVTAGGSEVPLPATLAAVHSTRNGAEVQVRLDTAVQVGVAGYELLAEQTGGRRVAVGFAAAGADTLDGGRVTINGRVDGNRYWIRVVDLDGQSQVHGPYLIGEQIGEPINPRPIDWAAVNAEAEAAEARQRAERSLGAAVWVRVSESGIQQLHYQDVVASALALDGVPVEQLALSRRGVAVPIKVLSDDQQFGPGDTIEFVAEAPGSLYTDEEVYLLEAGAGRGARISERRVARGPANTPLAVALAQRHAINRSYSFSSPLPDEPWFMDRIVANGAASPVQSYDFELAQLPATEAALELRLWGGIDYPGAIPDHTVEVRLNGELLDTLRFDGVQASEPRYLLPASSLRVGTNNLSLQLPAPSNPLDIVHVDSVALTVEGRPEVAGGRAQFAVAAGDYVAAPASDVLYSADFDALAGRDHCATAGVGEACRHVALDGLDSASARVYRAYPDGTVEALGGFAPGTVAFNQPYRAGVVVTAAAVDAMHQPAVVPAVSPAELPAAVDLLVVAHPQFVDGIGPLVDRRSSQGWRVAVVATDAVYARYSSGNVDPAAIQGVINDAANRGARAVLLVGGDTYDYHDRLGLGSRSFVPTLYTRLHPVVAHAPSDPLLADLNGDRSPDLAIGRLPVRSAAELSSALAKIVAYEEGSGSAEALFLADRIDGNGQDYASLSAFLRSRWGGPATTASLDTLSIEQARSAVIDASQAGAGLIHYLGHSSLATWSFPAPGVLSPSQIYAGALASTPSPTVLVQWGCWNSYHVAPRYDTLGHAWLLAPGAAAAVIGAATLTDSSHDVALAQHLLAAWAAGQVTLGEALSQAKRQLAADDPDAVDVLLGTTLLGDPTLPLR